MLKTRPKQLLGYLPLAFALPSIQLQDQGLKDGKFYQCATDDSQILLRSFSALIVSYVQTQVT